MFKVITDKEEFIQNPILEMNEEEIKRAKTDDIVLYGKHYRMYANDWKHHVHIKCTDRCDADCKFCIERSERNNPQNIDNMLLSTSIVLEELANQGHLKTVSITGGEPTIFPRLEELINIIDSYDLVLFSINTNGRFLNKIPSSYTGWVNISKHGINDASVFNRSFNITTDIVSDFKKKHPFTKVRFQCVLGTNENMKTLGNIIDFILEFKDVVDDFSFRNLIIESNEDEINKTLFDFRNILFNNGEFVEQVIQDYYVYETYKMFGTLITLSWSNMAKLKEYNESNNSNFLEEIIVHPDGVVAGSWNKKSLVIHTPKSRLKDEYIPCRGIGCESPCKRYISTSTPQKVHTIVDSCGSSIPSCDDYDSISLCESSIPSC